MQVCSDNDYETWSPPGNDRCLLGSKVTMQRRKQSSECFNDKGWQRESTAGVSCQCGHVCTSAPWSHFYLCMQGSTLSQPALMPHANHGMEWDDRVYLFLCQGVCHFLT